MEPANEVRPNDAGQEVQVDMASIKDSDILAVRQAMDAVSMTLLDHDFVSPKSSPLRIDYLNAFIIEGFDWFGGIGLSTFLTNRHLEFANGIIKVIGTRLDRPRSDEIQGANESVPLWPDDARLKSLNYSGKLTLRAEIHWFATEKQGKPEVIDIPFGKIPIMVGSAYCNLSTIQTQQQLVDVKEDSCEYMGFFVIKGNERNLISQNYLKPNSEIVITSKMGSSQLGRRTCCNNRSVGPDGMTALHRIYIASNHSNKITHSDRRIYVQMPWVKANVYDKGGASSTGISAIGINIFSIYRMAIVLLHTLDPTEPKGNYSITEGYRYRIGGDVVSRTSTFIEATAKFDEYVRDYGGERLMSLVNNYIVDTWNEAIIEENEERFWESTYRASGLKMDKPTAEPGAPKKAKDKEDSPDVPLSDKVDAILKTFGKEFFPHLSSRPYAIQVRELEVLKIELRREVHQAHMSTGVAIPPEQQEIEIDNTLQLLKDLSIKIQMNANMPPTDPNRPSEAEINQYKTSLASRGVVIGAGFRNYGEAIVKMAELRKDMEARMGLLAYMAVRVLRVEMNVDTYDDRDNLSNQLYDHPGMLMLSRFVSMTNEIAKSLRESKDIDLSDSKAIVSFLDKASNSVITEGYSKNFADGNWNAKKADKLRTGVTDIMPSSVTSAKISYLRRISAQSGGHSKNTSARELVGLQVGLICPSETPEGKQCGNVEHLATAAFITNDSYDNNTLAYRFAKTRTSRSQIKEEDVPSIIAHKTIDQFIQRMKDEKAYDVKYSISAKRRPDKNCPLFLNGRPIGWVNGLVFRRHLIEQRRAGLLHPHTGIHFMEKQSRVGLLNYLKIETGGGRIVQPLLIADDPQKAVNSLWRLITANANQRIASFSDLILNGMIEYVDAAELEFLDLAPSVGDFLRSVQDGLPDRYDHIMVNPSFLMGVAGNLMPFAQMNPVVRNSYFTQMVKQPVDVPLPTYQERTYTGVSVLHTPQVPIVKTDMYDKIYKNDYFGMNVKLLVTTHMNNEEDGIVVREGFLRNGGLSSTKYSMFTMDVEKEWQLNFNEGFMEAQEGAERYGRGVIRPTKEVVVVDPETGQTTIKREPVIVHPNELLARKLKPEGNQTAMKDLKYESLRDGIVDKVMWVKGEQGTKKLYVSISYPDNLVVGDKLAARYSQKGVIAEVVPDDQMPYDAETGERADIIMNPQAFPSRMTVGMMAEVLVANAHVYPDKNKTYGPLYESRGFDLFCPLERIFIVDEAAWLSFRTPDNKFPNPIGDLVNQEREVRPSNPSKPSIISSEEAVGQNEMNWLYANDQIKNIPGYENGLWALKFFGDRQGSIDKAEIKKRSGQRVSIQEAREFAPRGPKYIMIQMINATADANTTMAALLKSTNQIDRFFMSLVPQQGLIEQIPGIFFDSRKDEQTGLHLTPQIGIRLSKLPTGVLDSATNPFIHMGTTIQKIYLEGNWLTPVPTQYIAGYREKFFERQNLQDFYYDFGIPENARSLTGIIVGDSNVPQDMVIDARATYNKMKLEKTKIRVVGSDGALKETNLFDLWNDRYPANLLIPREMVVNLPEDARGIYTRRYEKIESLRRATFFKEGMDTNDAMRELKMMGYDEKARSTFIDPRTGKEIAHKITSGWSYYMPLKHKVKNKIQGRGLGKKDHLTRQPIAGRNFEGGMRFNYGDALAVYKSGAVNFVADRLLNASSKTDVYVCTDCRDICYQKADGMKDIVCPSCKITSRAIKISVPYVFLLQRNMLASAGVNLQVVAKSENDRDN